MIKRIYVMISLWRFLLAAGGACLGRLLLFALLSLASF
jgi:hypothetical protein